MSDKKYAKIGGYGSLVIPISLLEKIVEQGYIVQTTYNSTRSRQEVSKVELVTEVNIVDYSEIETQLAQQALEGK
jgi:hypothetical protein